MAQTRMKLDFWINNDERDEVVTVGHFGWVWNEGNCLLAGDGPRFGNDDPTGHVVAELQVPNGMWRLLDGRLFTDWDAQLAEVE